MDTSEQYIKMCEKAEEIQGQWKPTDWDYCYCKTEDWVVVLSGYETDGGYYGHGTPTESKISYYTGSCDEISRGDFKARHIWLPRQDQLQEMVRDICPKGSGLSYGYLGNYRLAHDFGEFCWAADCFKCPDIDCGAAMGQLWLAFVMKEKYNKIWNGEDWERRVDG